MDPILTASFAKLTEIGAKNSVASISTKIRSSKAEGDKDKTISELQEIIQELIDDRAELQRIGSILKERIIAESIDVSDIKYITNTIIPTVEKLLLEEAGSEKEKEKVQKYVNTLKDILSPEILTIFQLIGFNYKKAIGEPMTKLIEGLILSQVPPVSNEHLSEVLATRETEMYKTAQNKEAWERLLNSNG